MGMELDVTFVGGMAALWGFEMLEKPSGTTNGMDVAAGYRLLAV